MQVQIIEALLWIDRPLAAADLARIFEEQGVGLRIERRLRQLARLDVVALVDGEKAHPPLGQRSYRLARQPRP